MPMVDVSLKEVMMRTASAAGFIVLGHQSVTAIKQGAVRKGDPLLVAEVAGMNAAKLTSQLIPHCHQVPLDQVFFDFDVQENGVRVVCHVKAVAKTGVEMEALVGAAAALNTIFDMLKYLEKDEKGQYPITKITDIYVIEKKKEKI